MTSYACIDKDGNLVAKLSKDPDKIQDPASITKAWALYTMVKFHGDNWPEFRRQHIDDILEMMVLSNNAAAERLAQATCGNSRDFALKMNEYAKQYGRVSNTHFANASGHPDGHQNQINKGKNGEVYSTARDMALLMHRFSTDYPDVITDLVGRTNYGQFANRGLPVLDAGDTVAVKMGTSKGYFGDKGSQTLLGATKSGGTYCLLGVEDNGKFYEGEIFDKSIEISRNLENHINSNRLLQPDLPKTEPLPQKAKPNNLPENVEQTANILEEVFLANAGTKSNWIGKSYKMKMSNDGSAHFHIGNESVSFSKGKNDGEYSVWINFGDGPKLIQKINTNNLPKDNKCINFDEVKNILDSNSHRKTNSANVITQESLKDYLAENKVQSEVNYSEPPKPNFISQNQDKITNRLI